MGGSGASRPGRVVPRDGVPSAVDLVGDLLRRLGRSGGLLRPHDEAATGATLSQALALDELAGLPGLTQAQLGERLALEKSTVSRLVAGLERRGWIVRERDEDNRRFVRLRLTPEGRTVTTRISASVRDRHRELLQQLTDVELDALTIGLGGLARALDQAPP